MISVSVSVDFAWPRAHPEAGNSVVGTRAEDVAHGVVLHGPNCKLVCIRDHVGGVNDGCSTGKTRVRGDLIKKVMI